MTDDVVAELESWAEGIRRTVGPSVDADILQCACAEIVALRRYKHENHEASEVIRRAAELVRTQKEGAFADAKREVRNAALEEAARVCDEPARRLREELGWSAEAELLERYAAAIRALKEGHD